MQATYITSDFATVLPEIILAVGAMAMLMYGVFRGEQSADLVARAAVGLLILAGIVVLSGDADSQTAFGGSFIVDSFSHFMKALTIAGSAVAIIMSLDFARAERFHRFEYPVLVVLATLGMFMMISANDLIALYVGLELQSLSLYVVAAIQRDSVRSTEAGLKYFVLGALSSGMLLYGASLIYGTTGHTGFAEIAAALVTDDGGIGLLLGLVFLLAGLAFKVSAVPFHMWTPDVYEGAPTPVTAFFSAAPKMAAMAMFVRVMIQAFPEVTPQWQQIVVFISIASMVLGAFAAIGQTNIKRLMAYSSIGHMGFALIGLAAGTPEGIKGVVIYLAVYLAMTLGTFGCILTMRRRDGAVETIGDLAGLDRNDRPTAFFMAIMMFSLAGIPPMAGFFAKFYVFLAAVEAQLWPLAIIGVLASVVGAYYYLRIVKVMYFDEPAEAFEPVSVPLKMIIGVTGVFVLFFAAYPAPLVTAAGAAAASLF